MSMAGDYKALGHSLARPFTEHRLAGGSRTFRNSPPATVVRRELCESAGKPES